MSRYIDADTLKIPSEEMVAKMIIDSAPTIDIVRCKECQYWWRTTGSNYGDCRHFGLDTIENAYCSYGEREGE